MMHDLKIVRFFAVSKTRQLVKARAIWWVLGKRVSPQPTIDNVYQWWSWSSFTGWAPQYGCPPLVADLSLLNILNAHTQGVDNECAERAVPLVHARRDYLSLEPGHIGIGDCWYNHAWIPGGKYRNLKHPIKFILSQLIDYPYFPIYIHNIWVGYTCEGNAIAVPLQINWST